MKLFDLTSVNSVYFEGYILASSTSTELFLVIMSSITYDGVGVSNVNGNLAVRYGEFFGGSTDTGIVVEKDTWYKVKINIDVTFGKWKVWINNGSEISGDYSDTVLPALLSLAISGPVLGPLQKAYFDDIVLYHE